MTVAIKPSPNQVQFSNGDLKTIQRGRTWDQFRHLQQGLENTRGVKLAYYKGTIEILMPGVNHELFKTIIGFLVSVMNYSRWFPRQ